MFFSYPQEWIEKESTHGYGPIRLVWGERLMVAIVTVPANEPIHPFHTHSQEQIGVVLEGKITVTVGDKSRELKKGDAYMAPSNIPHGRSKRSKKQIKLLEVFSPPREDIIKR